MHVGAPQRLFGAHVSGGPQDDTDPSRISGESGGHRAIGVEPFLVEDFRQTEVQNNDLSVLGLLDVGRFQVSVNDAPFVRLLECVGHLGGDVESLFEWDGTA